MKQFNLEEYKKNQSRKVVTRDGLSVRIVCTDAKMPLNIVALIEQGDYDVVQRYPDNGICPKIENRDLFFAPEKKVIWGNLYSTQLGTTFSGDFYKTEEAALKEKAKDFSKYITTFKVEWEE